MERSEGRFRYAKLSVVLALGSALWAARPAPALETGDRALTVPTTVAAANAKNPAITTSGTLTVLQSISFSASATSSTSAAISYAWDFGDGSPLDTRQNPSHIYTVPGTYTVAVAISEAGNPTPVVKTLTAVITDAIKSAKLLAAFNFRKPAKDQLKLTGAVRVPTGDSLKGANVSLDIGGITLSFVLDEQGFAAITTNGNVVSGSNLGDSKVAGSFKIFVKSKPDGVSFEDAQFKLNLKQGTLLPALADEFVFDRDADRDPVRIVAKITLNGAVYQATLSPVFSARKGVGGTLR